MTKTFKSDTEIADEIDSKYEYRYSQIRNDTTRTDDWKRAQVARIYTDQMKDREAAIAERDRERDTYQRQLAQHIFGSGAAREEAAAVESRRTAGDRADLIEQPNHALDQLAKAERRGDEPMARAIIERAYEMRWTDVVNKFLEARPELDEDATELWNHRHPSLTQDFIEAMRMGVRPPEIADLTDLQVRRLAEEEQGESTQDGWDRWAQARG